MITLQHNVHPMAQCCAVVFSYLSMSVQKRLLTSPYNPGRYAHCSAVIRRHQ